MLRIEQPGKPTIQGTLADCIERITGEKVLPQGSGRTDAGVHALAQVASFSTNSPIPAANRPKAFRVVPHAAAMRARYAFSNRR